MLLWFMRQTNLFQSHSKGAAASDHLYVSSKDVFKKNNSTHRRNEKFWHEKAAFLFQNIENYCSRWFLWKTPSRIQLLLVDLWPMEQGHSVSVWLILTLNLQVTARLHHQGRTTVSFQDTSKKIISFHSFSTLPFTKAVTSPHFAAQSWVCNYSCCHKNASKREAY